MSNYLIKPREPTVLSHKEYHELSSTNLMLPSVVRLPLPHYVVPEVYADPLSCATDCDRPRNSRDPGYRKVQRCTERGIVELSAYDGETCEAGDTRHALDGTPLFPFLYYLELTTERRFDWRTRASLCQSSIATQTRSSQQTSSPNRPIAMWNP